MDEPRPSPGSSASRHESSRVPRGSSTAGSSSASPFGHRRGPPIRQWRPRGRRSLRRTSPPRWLVERQAYAEYADTETLWLTREGNPYQSQSLKYLLGRLCEIAGIDTANRTISWYAIRHSVGTYMAREEGLAAAQMQLRHQSEQTTMKYDQAPLEDRRDALDRMG